MIEIFLCWLLGHKPRSTGTLDIVICERCKIKGYSSGINIYWENKSSNERPNGKTCSSFDKEYCGLTGYMLKCENVDLCDEKDIVE